MKKFFLTIVVAGAANFTFAQSSVSQNTERFTVEERAQRMTDKLQSYLALTPAQKSKLYSVNFSMAKKMMEQSSSSTLATRTEIMNDRDSQYSKILTSEQFTKLKEMEGR